MRPPVHLHDPKPVLIRLRHVPHGYPYEVGDELEAWTSGVSVYAWTWSEEAPGDGWSVFFGQEYTLISIGPHKA